MVKEPNVSYWRRMFSYLEANGYKLCIYSGDNFRWCKSRTKITAELRLIAKGIIGSEPTETLKIH